MILHASMENQASSYTYHFIPLSYWRILLILPLLSYIMKVSTGSSLTDTCTHTHTLTTNSIIKQINKQYKQQHQKSTLLSLYTFHQEILLVQTSKYNQNLTISCHLHYHTDLSSIMSLLDISQHGSQNDPFKSYMKPYYSSVMDWPSEWKSKSLQ